MQHEFDPTPRAIKSGWLVLFRAAADKGEGKKKRTAGTNGAGGGGPGLQTITRGINIQGGLLSGWGYVYVATRKCIISRACVYTYGVKSSPPPHLLPQAAWPGQICCCCCCCWDFHSLVLLFRVITPSLLYLPTPCYCCYCYVHPAVLR